MRRAGAAVALAAVIMAAGCAGDADAGDEVASEAASSADELSTTSPATAGEDAEADSTEAVEGEGGDGPGHVTVSFGPMLPFQIDSFACTDDASRLDGTLALSHGTRRRRWISQTTHLFAHQRSPGIGS